MAAVVRTVARTTACAAAAAAAALAAMFGLVVVLGFVVLALCAPWIAPHDPIETSWSAIRKAPSACLLYTSPSPRD